MEKEEQSEQKKKTGDAASAPDSSSPMDVDAPETAYASLQRQEGQEGMNPRSILMGYGSRGERIRHTVHDGALRLPGSAIDILEKTQQECTQHNVEPKETFELPAIDGVLRPTMDKSLGEIIVTELTAFEPPKPPVPMQVEGAPPAPPQPEMPKWQTVAVNRRVPLSMVAGPERIRGGGEGDDPAAADNNVSSNPPSPVDASNLTAPAAPTQMTTTDPSLAGTPQETAVPAPTPAPPTATQPPVAGGAVTQASESEVVASEQQQSAQDAPSVETQVMPPPQAAPQQQVSSQPIDVDAPPPRPAPVVAPTAGAAAQAALQPTATAPAAAPVPAAPSLPTAAQAPMTQVPAPSTTVTAAAAPQQAAPSAAPPAASAAAPAPAAQVSATPEVEVVKPPPTASAPQVVSSSTAAASKPKTSAVVPLVSRPRPQWEQHIPGPNDEMQTEPRTPRPSWYDVEKVSEIERTMLPEWFDKSAKHRTPDSYKQTRERILQISDKIGNRNLTGTLIRRTIPGDAGSLLRLHSFLVSWGFINEDAINDSAPTPSGLREEVGTSSFTPKRAAAAVVWNEKSREELMEAVVDESKKRRKVDDTNASLVPIDWSAVATRVGNGASATDCERVFLSLPLEDASKRSITPDPASSEQQGVGSQDKTTMALKEKILKEIVDKSPPEVVKAATDAALQATDNVTEAQKAGLVALMASQAEMRAKKEEDAISRLLVELQEQRLQKLENRLALFDDVEGVLEAERVALELERRDLYTARCRHWFGGT